MLGALLAQGPIGLAPKVNLQDREKFVIPVIITAPSDTEHAIRMASSLMVAARVTSAAAELGQHGCWSMTAHGAGLPAFAADRPGGRRRAADHIQKCAASIASSARRARRFGPTGVSASVPVSRTTCLFAHHAWGRLRRVLGEQTTKGDALRDKGATWRHEPIGVGRRLALAGQR